MGGKRRSVRKSRHFLSLHPPCAEIGRCLTPTLPEIYSSTSSTPFLFSPTLHLRLEIPVGLVFPLNQQRDNEHRHTGNTSLACFATTHHHPAKNNTSSRPCLAGLSPLCPRQKSPRTTPPNHATSPSAPKSTTSLPSSTTTPAAQTWSLSGPARMSRRSWRTKYRMRTARARGKFWTTT